MESLRGIRTLIAMKRVIKMAIWLRAVTCCLLFCSPDTDLSFTLPSIERGSQCLDWMKFEISCEVKFAIKPIKR